MTIFDMAMCWAHAHRQSNALRNFWNDELVNQPRLHAETTTLAGEVL